MKTKIAVLTILATASFWAVAQNNDMNDKDTPGSSMDGARHHGKNHNPGSTNSESGYYHGGGTNHWEQNTNDWNNSNTNRHPGKRGGNPPGN